MTERSRNPLATVVAPVGVLLVAVGEHLAGVGRGGWRVWLGVWSLG